MNTRLRMFGPLPATEDCRAVAEVMGSGRATMVAADDDPMARRFGVSGAYRRATKASRPVVDPGAADPGIIFHDPAAR